MALVAKHEAVRRELRVASAAAQRAQSLLSLSGSALLEIVCEREAVVLPFWDRLHTYHLFYRADLDAFFVAVAACAEEGFDNGQPHIREIQTLGEYEADNGEASVMFRRTAASRVLDQVEYRAWDARTFGEETRRTQVRVITYYYTDDGRLAHVVFRGPPVCNDFIETYGLENSFGHPGFQDWYGRQVKKHGIDIEKAASIQIAITDKQTLRVDAPMRDCPDCVRRRKMPVQYTAEADEATDPRSARFSPRGALARLRTLLVRSERTAS
ncbi:hypothetical protein [Paraburkholderia sp. SIMBA_054]|uniref:hypothetical protein n=1 Tax=Paraburkholderia sp. SIMBA_054 TaxID=3085795 RepID=UPI003978C99F